MRLRLSLVLVAILCAYAVIAQSLPDSGFTNKAEAKNLIVNGTSATALYVKEGKWIEYKDTDALFFSDDDSNAHYYRLGIYKAGKLNGIVREYFRDYGSYYEDGELLSEVYYVNGMRNGVEKSYSYTTGKLERETSYQYDKMNGISKEYYNSGALESETSYMNDLENGVEKDYYESGKLKEEDPFLNGTINGILRMYWENGKLLTECTFVMDKKNGSDKSYYESGILRRECNWINDTLISKKRYYETGKLKSVTTYTKGIPVTTKNYDEKSNEIK